MIYLKKYLAFVLALLMLCMAGCGITVETGETTAQTTEETPVLLTAEDYFQKALEKDVADYMEYVNSYKTANMSVGVANVDYLLSLLAMNNSSLPKFEDVKLEMSADGESMVGNYLLSAKVNGHDASVGLGIDMTDFDIAIYSNLFEDVLGINYSELVGMEMPDMSAWVEFCYDFVEEYSIRFGELVMENNSAVELADNGETVTVTATLDGEDMYNLVKELVDTLAADERFTKTMSDIYQIDFAEVKAEFDDGAADMKAEMADSGVTLKIAADIDKVTFATYHVDVEVTDGTDTVVISADETEDAGTLNIKFNDEFVFELSYVSAPDTFAADLTFEVAGEGNCTGHINAEDGNFDVAVNVNASEYDWNAGKEVAVEYAVSMNGTYTVEGDKYTVTVGSISFNEITIDLTKAGITLYYELGGEVTTVPAVTKDFFDVTDEEGQALIMSIFEKLEIDLSMLGASAATPEIDMN